ncbi:uncharacterized protein LOC110689041 [Chenopodium quinoa]|uniref:uncharacterized protein LOC110689041 n=1 Tax=Chenopodium quinoa TaxID=63459 RepID=UPI000B799669|nr:uncharacterized protein LOC110689041 [Chenopodium quinoa]
MRDEYSALIETGTWDLVPRPTGVNIVNCLWLFCHKLKANGDLERHKARLVCDGRSQIKGVYCDEMFSPVVTPTTIRTVLSLAMARKWSIHQLDLKNAFLHGELNECVYMHQPLGFVDKRFSGYMGFFIAKMDNSLFIFRHGNGMAYLLLYVDDIVLVTSSDKLRESMSSCKPAQTPVDTQSKLSVDVGPQFHDPTFYRSLAGAL